MALFCLPMPSASAKSFSFVLSYLLLLSSCQHQEDSPNPCQAAKANPLAFYYLESTGTATADTAFNSQQITFVGPSAPYTSYQWQVGNLITRTSQQFTLSFDDTNYGIVPVTLIAHRPLNTACFPHDDGIDTLTQNLVLQPRPNLRAPIYGKFQGANKSTPRDTFTVRIYSGPNYAHPTIPQAEPTNYVSNLPKGCSSPYVYVGVGWKGAFMSTGGCSGLQGKAYLLSHDSIRIDYRTQVSPSIIDEVFLGKRIR